MSDCNKCKYGYKNYCDVTRKTQGCYECDNFDEDTLECRCTTMPTDADCPYFQEWEDEDCV